MFTGVNSQANIRERLSLEPKGCDEEDGWSQEAALGWADPHPKWRLPKAPRQRL